MFDMVDMLGHSGYDFRSSIVLTYSLDIPLYDGLIRRALNRSGIWNQVIFCDFCSYVEEIQSQTVALYSGKHYSVTPIWQQGAFHPKVYLLLGPRHGRLLIGSGNATVGGLIRNAELFGLFDFDGDKSQAAHPAFSELFEFAEKLGRDASETVRRQIKNARQMAPWLANPPAPDGRVVLIGGPGKPDLLTQILEHLPTKKADSLITLSSSFDRNLEGLKKLASKSKSKPICIVQLENAEIDGQAVQKTRGRFEWRPFLDPYPREKRHRKDVRAHAKIFVFGHGPTETCVFGSANASAPALESKNTEVIVVLPTCRRGYNCKYLGLEASLKAKSIQKALGEKQWAKKDERPESKFSCLLSAVTFAEASYRLSFASGVPTKTSRLALSDRSLGGPRTMATIQKEGDAFMAPSPKGDERIRFAWIATESGKPLSNAVVITWPMVAAPRKLGGSSAKVGPALMAMQDGAVLGTVLFELLDQFRDFEVIKIGAGRRAATKKETSEGEDATKEQSAEFFYTDAKADDMNSHHWTGDRIDLDILASLVQPLSPLGTGQKDEDEEYDDSKLAEEAERRQIEAKGGKGTGGERQSDPLPPSKRLEAAIKRLERRLDRAARSIEDSLAYLENLQALPPNGIARQVWMTHIGAFLANRITVSDEGDHFVCLHPWCFAQYVLRVCRALTGSKKIGGFLDKLPESSWEGFDGDALRKGIAFLWTCVSWAAAYMVRYYSDGKGREDVPESIAVASAELVAGRFIWKASAHCNEPDRNDLQRRFPAWNILPLDYMEDAASRFKQLASLITNVEVGGQKSNPDRESDTVTLKAGTVVHNPTYGVSMLAYDASPGGYYLVDLSQCDDRPKKFGAMVAPVLFDGKPFTVFQRTAQMEAA